MTAPRDRHFRDPVHDYISFRGSSRTDRLLLDLVDAREVQRLRRVRQLGLANLVFQGAEHSRFPHALGAMQVAREMLDALARSAPRLRRHEEVLTGQAASPRHSPTARARRILWVLGIDRLELWHHSVAGPVSAKSNCPTTTRDSCREGHVFVAGFIRI